MKKISVMLVDDQMLLREGLKTIINMQEDMETTAEAEHGQAALDLMQRISADVILMDIRMPVMDGVKASALIKNQYPNTSIIILTTFDDDDYIVEALANGADGYLLKDIDAADLVEAIRQVRKGQLMLPGKIANKLAARIHGLQQSCNSEKPSGERLSQREKEIGSLLIRGMNNRQIAKKLFLSEGTVKNYVSDIYFKIGVNNRMEAALLIQQMLEESQ